VTQTILTQDTERIDNSVTQTILTQDTARIGNSVTQTILTQDTERILTNHKKPQHRKLKL
jgi:hypothetical protein